MQINPVILSLIILTLLLGLILPLVISKESQASFSFLGVLDECTDGWAVLLDDQGQQWFLPSEMLTAAQEGWVYKVTILLDREIRETVDRKQSVATLFTVLLQ
mgnify:CR=1 FL=1